MDFAVLEQMLNFLQKLLLYYSGDSKAKNGLLVERKQVPVENLNYIVKYSIKNDLRPTDLLEAVYTINTYDPKDSYKPYDASLSRQCNRNVYFVLYSSDNAPRIEKARTIENINIFYIDIDTIKDTYKDSTIKNMCLFCTELIRTSYRDISDLLTYPILYSMTEQLVLTYFIRSNYILPDGEIADSLRGRSSEKDLKVLNEIEQIIVKEEIHELTLSQAMKTFAEFLMGQNRELWQEFEKNELLKHNLLHLF